MAPSDVRFFEVDLLKEEGEVFGFSHSLGKAGGDGSFRLGVPFWRSDENTKSHR